MIEYTLIHDAISLANYISIEALADFIHYQSIPYEDTKQAIIKAIEYSFSKDVGKCGFIIVAMDNREVIGASVVNYSGMDLYIPNVFLVYIAVSEDHRGQGIGSSIIRKIIENCKGSIALHVEYNNPARSLYERLGFVSKYAEMRLERS